jgi:hypothetical protein
MSADQEPAPPSIEEVAERVREDLWMLRDAASRRRDELYDRARGFIDQHPLAAVGAAFALGYVLSGALLSRATVRVAVLAGRLFLGRAMRAAAESGVEAVHGNGAERGGAT